MTDEAARRAIERALAEPFAYANERMSGTRADLIEWGERKAAAPAAIVKALQDAGVVLRPIGGDPIVRIEIKDWDPENGRYDREIRAEADMPFPMTLFAEMRAHPQDRSKRYAEHIALGAVDLMVREIRNRLAERVLGGMLKAADWTE
jgi:hypothetical protein